MRLLVLGDSTAAGVGAIHLEQTFAGQLVGDLARDFTVHWRVEALGGATTAEMLARLLTLDLGRLDVAVAVLGMNDVRRQVSPRRFRQGHRAIAALLLGHGASQVWRAGVPPFERFPNIPWPWRDVLGAQARVLDAVLERDSIAPLYRLPYDATLLNPANLAHDGMHPGPEVYAEWARRQAREIRLRA